MREELNDLKWQDCDPQSWSLWYDAILLIFFSSINISSGGFLPLQFHLKIAAFSHHRPAFSLSLMLFPRHWIHSKGSRLPLHYWVTVLGGIDTCNPNEIHGIIPVFTLHPDMFAAQLNSNVARQRFLRSSAVWTIWYVAHRFYPLNSVLLTSNVLSEWSSCHQ